jgi:hypothetical protein
MQYTTSTQKGMVGKCICDVGRQEITENLYVLWSTYRACAPDNLSVIKKSVNISGDPFNTAKLKPIGRIEGGNTAPIEHHPHQVKLLKFC